MGIENVGLGLHLSPGGKRFLLTLLSGTGLGCGLPLATWLLTRSFWISAEVYFVVFVPIYLVSHLRLWIGFWNAFRHGSQRNRYHKLNTRVSESAAELYLGYIYAPIVLLGIYLLLAVLVALP